MGRADHAGADRLIDTCPMKTYRIQDLTYLEGLRAVHDCCLHALLMIEQAAVKMLSAMGLLLGTLDSEEADKRELADRACDAYAVARGRLFGYWEAWREFCAEVGVDPAALMRAGWGGVPNWITEPLFFPEVDELIGTSLRYTFQCPTPFTCPDPLTAEPDSTLPPVPFRGTRLRVEH
jgi:hypothetical protein